MIFASRGGYFFDFFAALAAFGFAAPVFFLARAFAFFSTPLWGFADFFVAGFSPRKQNLTVYLSSGYGKYADLMKKLGKHTTGASCLYIKSLDDIDQKVLRELIVKGVKDMPKRITKADRISTRGS